MNYLNMLDNKKFSGGKKTMINRKYVKKCSRSSIFSFASKKAKKIRTTILTVFLILLSNLAAIPSITADEPTVHAEE